MKIIIKPNEILKLINLYKEDKSETEIVLSNKIIEMERKIHAQEIIINMQKDKKLFTDDIIKNLDKKEIK